MKQKLDNFLSVGGINQLIHSGMVGYHLKFSLANKYPAIGYLCLDEYQEVSDHPLIDNLDNYLIIFTGDATPVNVLPQSCGKIATEVDAAFRTPKNPTKT